MSKAKYNMPFEIKADEQGYFTGYASAFDVVDNQKDSIQQGAFLESLAKKDNGKKIKFLWQHDSSQPIGYFEEIYEDFYGLFVKGKFLLELEKAQEAYTLLKAGAVEGLSIGYRTKKAKIDPKTGVRQIQQLDLFEISLVTFPANDAATVRMVKAKDKQEIKKLKSTGKLVQLSEAIDKAIHKLIN